MIFIGSVLACRVHVDLWAGFLRESLLRVAIAITLPELLVFDFARFCYSNYYLFIHLLCLFLVLFAILVGCQSESSRCALIVADTTSLLDLSLLFDRRIC